MTQIYVSKQLANQSDAKQSIPVLMYVLKLTFILKLFTQTH